MRVNRCSLWKTGELQPGPRGTCTALPTRGRRTSIRSRKQKGQGKRRERELKIPLWGQCKKDGLVPGGRRGNPEKKRTRKGRRELVRPLAQGQREDVRAAGERQNEQNQKNGARQKGKGTVQQHKGREYILTKSTPKKKPGREIQEEGKPTVTRNVKDQLELYIQTFAPRKAELNGRPGRGVLRQGKY